MNELKQKLVERLKKDCEVLLNVKMPKVLDSIETKGDGTYRNLINALGNMMKLIEEYDWQLHYSQYGTTNDKGEEVYQVAVWEQNGDGDIKNHKVWDVEDKSKKIEPNYYSFWKQQMERLIWEDGNNKIIIPVSEAIRGVGKTTFLLEQAIKHDGIYIAPNHSVNRHAMEKAKKLFGVIPMSGYQFVKNENGKTDLSGMGKRLFIDECVDLDKFDLDNVDYIAFKYVGVEKK